MNSPIASVFLTMLAALAAHEWMGISIKEFLLWLIVVKLIYIQYELRKLT